MKTVKLDGHATGVDEKTRNCRSASKWAALLEDTVVWAPQRIVKASVLLVQAGVGTDKILVRDHGGGNDVAIRHDEDVDLALGNPSTLSLHVTLRLGGSASSQRNSRGLWTTGQKSR